MSPRPLLQEDQRRQYIWGITRSFQRRGEKRALIWVLLSGIGWLSSFYWFLLKCGWSWAIPQRVAATHYGACGPNSWLWLWSRAQRPLAPTLGVCRSTGSFTLTHHIHFSKLTALYTRKRVNCTVYKSLLKKKLFFKVVKGNLPKMFTLAKRKSQN